MKNERIDIRKASLDTAADAEKWDIEKYFGEVRYEQVVEFLENAINYGRTITSIRISRRLRELDPDRFDKLVLPRLQKLSLPWRVHEMRLTDEYNRHAKATDAMSATLETLDFIYSSTQMPTQGFERYKDRLFANTILRDKLSDAFLGSEVADESDIVRRWVKAAESQLQFRTLYPEEYEKFGGLSDFTNQGQTIQDIAQIAFGIQPQDVHLSVRLASALKELEPALFKKWLPQIRDLSYERMKVFYRHDGVSDNNQEAEQTVLEDLTLAVATKQLIESMPKNQQSGASLPVTRTY